MRRRLFTTVLVMLSLTAVAWADDNRGATVAGSVSATNMDARTQFSFAGTFGYRFSDVVGLEVEATVVPAIRSAYPDVSFANYPSAPVTTLTTTSVQLYPSPLYTNTGGRMVIFSNNVRITIPTTTPRLEPYFVAGGGVASVRRTADFRYPVPFPLGATVVIGTPVPDYRISALPVRSSEVDLALTLGGGVGIKLMSHVWLDADLRLIRLMGGSSDRNVGRFGVGARYRF